jgi:serine/threonine protein phosphatase 1
MTPLYAIGDIHGQKTMLDQALDLIHADGGDDAQIVFLGDYTDRGPDSRAVIETLVAGQVTGRNWTFLRGNHDRMFGRFVRNGIEHDARIKSGAGWLNERLGGPMTLASYGIEGVMHLEREPDSYRESLVSFEGPDGQMDKAGLQALAAAAVPQTHLDFLESLKLWHETDDLLFVHAGLRPWIALREQDIEDLLWIREPFLDNDHDHGKLVVHGHTALEAPWHFGNRVDLDGGAGYGRPLVPAVFEGRDCWLLTDRGRVQLVP